MTSSGHVHSDCQRYDMASRVTRERALNVAENVGVPFCTRRIAQENDFELILMVKMEARHPVVGYFGREFRVVCNHCGIVAAAGSHKTWKFVEELLRFWKTTHGNFSKFCSESFYGDTDRRCCVQISCCRWEIGKIVRYLPDQTNFGCLSNVSRYFADCAQSLPRPAPNNVLKVLEI